MKKNHLNIILAGTNQTRCNNMASRVRFQGHKVDLVDSGFQTLNEIEKQDNEYQMVFFLGDMLEDMQSTEAISHLRVIKGPKQLFILHIADEKESLGLSIQNGSSMVLPDENFNQIISALEQALKLI